MTVAQSLVFVHRVHQTTSLRMCSPFFSVLCVLLSCAPQSWWIVTPTLPGTRPKGGMGFSSFTSNTSGLQPQQIASSRLAVHKRPSHHSPTRYPQVSSAPNLVSSCTSHAEVRPCRTHEPCSQSTQVPGRLAAPRWPGERNPPN